MDINEDMLEDLVEPQIATESSSSNNVKLIAISHHCEKIKTALESINELNSMLEIATDKAGVSQSDVAMVVANESLSGFTNSHKVEQFTKQKSTLFQTDLVKYVQKRIAIESMEVNGLYKTIFEEPMEEIALFMQHFQSYYFPNNEISIARINARFSTLIQASDLSPNFIVPVTGGFINLIKDPISTVASTDPLLDGYGDLVAKFTYGIKALVDIFKDVNFCLFYQSLHNEGFAVNKTVTISPDSITLFGIMKLYDGDSFSTWLHYAETSLNETFKKLQDLKILVGNPVFTVTDLESYLVEHQPAITDCFAKIEFIQSTLRNTLLFHAAVQEVFALLNECK